MLENGAVCMYNRVKSIENPIVTFRCDQPASWAGTCRKCGSVSLLCEEHYITLNVTRPAHMQMRCARCHAPATKFSDLYIFVHKI